MDKIHKVIHKITDKYLGKPILAVYANTDVYVGCGCNFYNMTTDEIIFLHEKSVKCITGDAQYVCSGSYDGKVAVYSNDKGKVVETIEGPDTEIKCVALNGEKIAISTRGKTVWVLEKFEISKIIEDHTQDVKGCRFYEGRLYSWSFDNTVKMYELFDIESSWEMVQSINLGTIVWEVVFYNNEMCCATNDGYIHRYKMADGVWVFIVKYKISNYPLKCITVLKNSNDDDILAAIVNGNYLVFMDTSYDIIDSIHLVPCNNSNSCDLSSNQNNHSNENNLSGNDNPIVYFNNKILTPFYEITSLSFSKSLNLLVCGAENGYVYSIEIN